MVNFQRGTLLWLGVVVLGVRLLGRADHAAQMRFALVIGNDEYKSAKLATPANDAGLVADAPTAAGCSQRGLAAPLYAS